MAKTLVVFGATGQQGSSVINNVLADPYLSKEYNIRAITRDTNSGKATELKENNVEVVKGDISDRASLESALTGAHTVFIVTTLGNGPNPLEDEFENGKRAADVAVEKGAHYIIFSTLTPINKMSGGKYTKVTMFDAKAKIEEYIRSLPIKSAFCCFGFYMENFEVTPFMGPQKAQDGTWVLSRPNPGHVKAPYLAAVADAGKFAGAILAEPEKFEGKTLLASQAFYSWDEVAQILSKTLGKEIVFKQVPADEFVSSLPWIGEAFGEAFAMLEEYGYYGPGSEDRVTWAAENARGRLITMEEYYTAKPLPLE